MRRRSKTLLLGLVSLCAVLLIGWVVMAYVIEPGYAPHPSRERALNPPAATAPDSVDAESVKLGREAFYEETFDNEIFITDVAGMIAGPLPLDQYVKAIAALHGKGTTDLTVEVAADATIGGRKFRKGQILHTGLDVLPGGVSPLGLKISVRDGQPHVGMTCALCHSTVDRTTHALVEGAPNTDIHMGILMAFAANSTAFLPNAEIESLQKYVGPDAASLQQRDGKRAQLPDARALEQAVDAVFLSWPPGYFDSTPDLTANPSQIPSSFTRGAHPYGWTGFAAAGPFHGLSVLNNNVHGVNADAIANSAASLTLFDIDPELFIATLLQGAASSAWRFDPRGSKRPSDFLRERAGADRYPGTAQHVRLPTFPKPSYVGPNGLWMSKPGRRVWEQINAMSAFQNTLAPPPAASDPTDHSAGAALFARAACGQCHAGPYFTNNRVLPLSQIGTDPSRAPAMHKLTTELVPPQGWPLSAKVPLPADTQPVAMPIDDALREQLELAWAFDGTGGYKVPSLLGLAWTAPYLHDGGVAVGPDAERDLGLRGTSMRDVLPDPANSLMALLDRRQRERVVAANGGEPALQRMHIRGVGHEFWVDSQSGYTLAEQRALVGYLLALSPPSAAESSSP
jgi:hypothetical protein